MTIRRKDRWVQIARLDARDRIRFTPVFTRILGHLGWEAKAFVGHLLGLWYDPFEHMLDYSAGEAKHTKDQPGRFDRNSLDEPQDAVEYWAERWARNDSFHEPAQEAGTGLGLDVEWHCDVLRAKLVSLRLPERLLRAYERASVRTEKELLKKLVKRGVVKRWPRRKPKAP